MAPTIDDLTTPLTTEEVKASIYSVIGQLGLPTTNWKPIAPTRVMIAGCSVVLAALSQLTSKIARAGWAELSSGGWLDLVARYVYNEERRDVTFAEGDWAWVNASTNSYGFAAEQFVVFNNATGARYANVDDITFPPGGSGGFVSGDLGPIRIRAIEAGAASSALPLQIQGLETPLTGLAGQNINTITGTDAEDDQELFIRCNDKLGSLSPNGPPDAYGFVARNAVRLDGTAIGVTRVREVNDGQGGLTVYVANAAGPIPGTASDPSTDLGAVHDALQQMATPLCVTETTAPAEAVGVDITYEIWLYGASLTSAQIQTEIQSRIDAFFASQPIGGNDIDGTGGKIFASAIQAAISQATPKLSVVKAVLSLPAADVSLTAAQVAVRGNITVAGIHQLATPLTV